VQTPQAFKFKMWKKTKSNQGTDFFSSIGFNLKKENFVIGELENFKITTKTDLKFAKKLII
jgi:2-C-methyl-D-erythritol 4-phosphate cytidylyltransferase